MQKIPGGCSYLARLALRTFFPLSGDSLDTGIVIKGPDCSYIVKAKFAGFLADLKEHKSITEWKGPGANVCCLRCSNLWKPATGDHADGTIGLDCFDPAKFRRRSSDSVHRLCEALAAKKGTLSKTAFAKAETAAGINYLPPGILWDVSLHGIYLPVEHIIVDWMHTFCSDGVANTCIWTTIEFLKQAGYAPSDVREFLTLCRMPSKYGKPDPAWLHDNRLQGTSLSAFASSVLHLVPILYLFFDKFCSRDARLRDVGRYLKLMYMIVGTLATGPDAAPHHSEFLRQSMSDFHKLHVELSDDLKPKLHHMHHVVDGMQWLGKLLSCFVTERKHRHIKDSALHVFRHLEHTVLHDVVNKQCQQMVEGVELFKEEFLVHPRLVSDVPDLRRSTRAVLQIGGVHTDDIVWLTGAKCGRAKMFYQFGDDMLAHLALFENAAGVPDQFDERQSVDAFVDTRTIIDTCTWYYDSPSILKVAVPPLAVLSA